MIRSLPGTLAHRTRWVLLALVFAGALVAASGAAAQEPLPPDEAALIDQYREDVPTAEGPRLPGESGGTDEGGAAGGGGSSPPPPLARAVRSELFGALPEAEAAALERLATAPELGAPAVAPPAGGAGGGLDEDAVRGGSPSPFSAFGSAFSDGSGDRLVGLLAALAFMTAGAIAAAAFGRRRPAA